MNHFSNDTDDTDENYENDNEKNHENQKNQNITNLKNQEDLSIVQSRISEVIRILSSFKELSDPTKSRSDYTQLLINDLATYYGYNLYLAELLFHLFPLSEIIEFFEVFRVIMVT